jgi:Gluconate 2-dehydrogenase subunit 3
MKVKRRRFIQALAAAPAVPLVAQQRGAAPSNAAPAPVLSTTAAEAEPETSPRFFSAAQFAALHRLGNLFMPPRKGHPGALDAGAPEFIDFLVEVSSADRQQLYRNGLDTLNARAKTLFGKSFADLDDAQADTILRPLVVTIAWVLDRPTDPLEHFVAQVHDDLRTATVNSREWADAAAAQNAGRRGRASGVDTFIRPIDPVYRG